MSFKAITMTMVRIAVVSSLAVPSAIARPDPEWRESRPAAPAAFPAGMLLAQTDGGDGEDRSDPDQADPDAPAPDVTTPGPGVTGPGAYAPSDGGRYHLAFSDAITAGIVRILESAARQCGQLPYEYRPDCLQVSFRRAAAATEQRSDYAAAAAHLNAASRRISRLVSRNLDPAARRIGNYRAVKKSAARAVNSEASAIITETATKLLRSAGSSQQRKNHYQRIAQAVGSTKRILRS